MNFFTLLLLYVYVMSKQAWVSFAVSIEAKDLILIDVSQESLLFQHN